MPNFSNSRPFTLPKTLPELLEVTYHPTRISTRFPIQRTFVYMIFRSPKTLEELLEFFEITYCCNPSSMAFVCIEKKTGKVATLITLIACDTYHRKATIAMGIAFRGFWGTSFTTLSAGSSSVIASTRRWMQFLNWVSGGSSGRATGTPTTLLLRSSRDDWVCVLRRRRGGLGSFHN